MERYVGDVKKTSEATYEDQYRDEMQRLAQQIQSVIDLLHEERQSHSTCYTITK